MFMTIDGYFVYCILLDDMRPLVGMQIGQTILANEAILCLGGGAGDLFIGSSIVGSSSGSG